MENARHDGDDNDGDDDDKDDGNDDDDDDDDDDSNNSCWRLSWPNNNILFKMGSNADWKVKIDIKPLHKTASTQSFETRPRHISPIFLVEVV